MFLDASDEVLLRRFSETRRRHPLSGDDLLDGVRRDRELMAELRQGAAVVDTSNLNMHQLKAIIQDRYGGTGKLAVTFVSFGFKHGLPLEFNLVFDVRFLPNPYFEPTLTHLDGRDPEVAKFVFGPDGTRARATDRGPAAVLAPAVPEGRQAVRHDLRRLHRRTSPFGRRRRGAAAAARPASGTSWCVTATWSEGRDGGDDRPRRRMKIQNELGLARACGDQARAARVEVSVRDDASTKDGHEVNGKSIMGVLMLVASKGTTVTLRAKGEQGRTRRSTRSRS